MRALFDSDVDRKNAGPLLTRMQTEFVLFIEKCVRLTTLDR
jgi:hypothetical protein